jgi:hypothetical protein
MAVAVENVSRRTFPNFTWDGIAFCLALVLVTQMGKIEPGCHRTERPWVVSPVLAQI